MQLSVRGITCAVPKDGVDAVTVARDGMEFSNTPSAGTRRMRAATAE